MFSDKRKTRILSPVLSGAAMALVWGGLADSALAQGGGKKVDTTPPAAVSDLRVIVSTHNSIIFGWTATGDDRNLGTASAYDIRYSIAPITEANFVSATPVPCSAPMPRAVGYLDRVTVGGSSNTTYYLALKVADEVPNWSALSNVVSATTLPPPAPAVWDIQIVDASDVSALWASFDFTSSGNPGTAYQEYGESRLRFAEWDGACWQIEDVFQGYAPGISFAYDRVSDIPTMSYYYGGLRFAEKVGSSWDIALVDGRYGSGNQDYTSLAYDGAGNPAISYSGTTKIGKNSFVYVLKLARWTGSAWATEIVDSGANARSNDLAFDLAGNPAIAYSASIVNNQDTLKLVRWDPSSSSWSLAFSETGPTNFGWDVKVAFDPTTGYPAMLHRGADTARFVRWNGSQWETEDLETTAVWNVLGCDLWYDTDGTAWAAWKADYELKDELKVRRRDPLSGLWDPPEVVDSEFLIYSTFSLKRAPSSTLAVAYGVGVGVQGAITSYSLRYATRSAP